MNVALSMVSLLETRDEGLILDQLSALDLSPMYKRLSDEAYHTQDQNTFDGDILKNSYLRKDARLILAGMIMERNARRRRKQRAAIVARVKEARSGLWEDPSHFNEDLP